MLIVESSHPASKSASSASWLNSEMPVKARTKSYSASHGIRGLISVFFVLASSCVWSMFTLINYLGYVARVIFRVAWSAPDGHPATISCWERTQQLPPRMCASTRLLDPPAKALCVDDRALDVFIGMPWPAHPAYLRKPVDNCQARGKEQVGCVRAHVSRSEQKSPRNLMAGGLDGSFRFRSRPVLLDFDVIGHPAREDRPFDLTALGVEQRAFIAHAHERMIGARW
jgi:hypothetical protein